MKIKKSVFLAIVLVASMISVKGQATKDTTRVPCLYLTDSASFKTVTGWLTKVTTYEMQFQQQAAPAGVDSFTVKKVKVPTSAQYFERLFVLGNAWKYKPAIVLAEFKDPFTK